MVQQKNKKVVLFVLLSMLAIALVGCKGSKDIQGKWYAVNSDGTRMTITLNEKKITFASDGKKTKKSSYTQNGTGFENNVSYKSIQFDGETVSFVFPDKKDTKNAVILAPDDSDKPTKGTIYWVLSKDDYPDYNQYK